MFFSDEEEEQTVRDLESLILTGNKPNRLRTFSYRDYLVNDMFRGRLQAVKDQLTCVLCRAVARVLVGYRRKGASREDAAYAANAVCVGARIASKNVCKGAIDLNIVRILLPSPINHSFDRNRRITCRYN